MATMDVVADSTRLTDAVVDFVVERTDDLLGRFCHAGVPPQFFLGSRIDPVAGTDLMQVLSLLPEFTVYRVGGQDVEEALVGLLRAVDPRRQRPAMAYRLAESLARFGAWTVNPVVAELDDETKERLRANTDELVRRGGFGSPTLFVDENDMYFGNDRLPLVRRALERAT